MTAQDDYLDAALRHQIGIRRFSGGEAKKVLALIEQADRELVNQLRRRLARLGGVTDFTSERYRAMITDIRALRRELMVALRQEVRDDMLELSKLEAGFEQRMLASAIPVEVGFAQVSATQLRAIVTKRPFQGRLLREWFQTLEQDDRRRLEDAIQQGLAQGESIQQIVRRVAGTRAQRFTNGALSVTRRQAEAVVRTAVNHVSNAARETVWEENSDIIGGLQWVATLDGRTSGVCRARDGKVAPIAGSKPPPDTEPLVPAGARPPAHVNCRSVMIAILDGDEILGDRPFVTDTRTRQKREVDFRKIAKEKGITVAQARKQWSDRNIGTLPAKTTYDEFLRRQSAEFQNEVLGTTKAKLFRAGERLDRFVDRRGNELTLQQLADTRPESFKRAGLDPDDF